MNLILNEIVCLFSNNTKELRIGATKTISVNYLKHYLRITRMS